MTRTPTLTPWHPASWQSRRAQQQPVYADAAAVDRTVAALSRLPPIVVSWEVEALRKHLASAQRGERFLLQMSLVLLHGLKMPIVRVGRMAGQYAKPRSADTETRDGVTLPSYRGDLVNRAPFTAADREPDPQLLLRGYERAALTFNFVRALVDGGFADLHHPEYWNLSFVSHSPLKDAYQRIVESIGDSLDFFESISGRAVHETNRVEFYASHEGLHLLYEQAQTRFIPRQQRWYDLSTHMPWIGMRTAQVDSAHVEFFRGIANPVGVKNIERDLPPLVQAVRGTGQTVLWVCDPMHGNTETTSAGVKTRRFDNILAEFETARRIHEELGSYLGGVHFELTGEDVSECIGGARGLTEADLKRAYRSQVDPRLNYEQALELAMLIARHRPATR